MSLEIEELWQCTECDEIHDYEDSAINCCKPEILTLFKCTACDTVHDLPSSAKKCCTEDILCPKCLRDHHEHSINASAVKVTGHCSYCNPFYSPDEVVAVEELHLRKTKYIGCITRGISNILETRR